MSERTVYAIASGKGGVGKTTTAVNLGAMLAERDHSVVVVDADLGMANLADFLEIEIETPTLQEVLAGEADVEDAVHRAPGDVDVVPSATDIEAFTRSEPKNLQGVVAVLREAYDYVLLDTGAGVSYDTIVPLALADAVLLVATPDVASVRDTAKTGDLAERVETEVVGALLTQRSSDILNADDVEETLGTDVLAVVPQDEAVPMGVDAGRPLAAFAPNAPAGQAYRQLAGVLTGATAPEPELATAAETDDEATDSRETGNDRRTRGGSSRSVRGGTDAGPSATSDGSAGERGGASDDAPEADAGKSADSDSDILVGADDSEARSVDDLIDEHIAADRLGDEADSPGEGASTGDSDAPTGTNEDSSADAESDTFLEDDEDDDYYRGGGGGERSAGGDESSAESDASGNAEAGSSDDSSSIPFDADDSSDAVDDSDADARSEGAEPATETALSDDEASADADGGGDESGDERSGLLGRIGSLFG